MGHIQSHLKVVRTDVPRTEEATKAAERLRTWVGRSRLMSARMAEMERELNALRAAVQARHKFHDDPCELCDVLYPCGVEHE